MAHRLAVSDRAAREIGDAYEWYEIQLPHLGTEFLKALDPQFKLIVQTPLIYAETQRGIRRALLAQFPYGVFYALKGDVVSVLGVVHTSRNPRRWPRPA